MAIKSFFRRSGGDSSGSPTLQMRFRLRRSPKNHDAVTCVANTSVPQTGHAKNAGIIVKTDAAPRPVALTAPSSHRPGQDVSAAVRRSDRSGQYGSSSGGGNGGGEGGGRQVMYVQHEMIAKHNDNEEAGYGGNDCDGGDGGE